MSQKDGNSNGIVMPPRKWLRTMEAARYLGVDRSFLMALAKKGEIPRYRHNSRCAFYSVDDLDQWVSSKAEKTQKGA